MPPKRRSTRSAAGRRSKPPPAPVSSSEEVEPDDDDEDEMSSEASSSDDDDQAINIASTRSGCQARKRRHGSSSSPDNVSDQDGDFRIDLDESNLPPTGSKRPRRARASSLPKSLSEGSIEQTSTEKKSKADPPHVLEAKATAISCPYFQQIHRPDLKNAKEIRKPKDPAALKYCQMKLAELRDRLKFVCRRSDISQQRVADCFGINNGNMSASLQGSYKPASSRVYVYLIWQWVYQMDRKFVDEFKTYVAAKEHLENADHESVAKVLSNQSGVAVEAIRSFLDFTMNPQDRNPIDIAILRYMDTEGVLSLPRRGRPRQSSLSLAPSISVNSTTASAPQLDAASEGVLRSWFSRQGTNVEEQLQGFVHTNFSQVKFQVDAEPVALEALRCFTSTNNDIFVNAGGPITVMEWITDRTNKPYLMVCSENSLAGPREVQNPALIQFYEVSIADGQLTATLKLGLSVRNVGYVVSAQFCPWKLTNQSLPEVSCIGILAVTGADGSLAIVPIPDPATQTLSSRFCLIQMDPVLQYSASETQCYSLAWHPNQDKKGMPIIISGTQQGNVLLFDIRQDWGRPELVIPVARTVNDCVTNVVWCLHHSSQFVIGSHSGIIRLFDLQSPYVPIWSYDAHRPVYGIEPIMNGEGFLIAMANGVRFLSPSTACTSAPLFWLDLPLEGVSPTSLSLIRMPSSHLIASLTTDNGLALFAQIPERIHVKKSLQDRIVCVLSSATPGSAPNSRIHFAKAKSPSYEVVKLARSNQKLREKLRQSLPKPGSAEMLLDPNMLMTRCAMHWCSESTNIPLFASGGYAGIVRLQALPPVRSSS